MYRTVSQCDHAKLPWHSIATLPCTVLHRRTYARVWWFFTARVLLLIDRQTDIASDWVQFCSRLECSASASTHANDSWNWWTQCNAEIYNTELSVGPIFLTQTNPAHQTTDRNQPQLVCCYTLMWRQENNAVAAGYDRLMDWLIDSFIHSFIYSFIHSLIHSSTHSFVLLILFIHSLRSSSHTIVHAYAHKKEEKP